MQRLLAYDGSHPSTGGVLPVQRRMNWQKTDWSKAKFLTASSGGGGGVLFVGETEREVVVKPGEELATETALASMLINKVGKARRTRGEKRLGKGRGKGGMSILAPGVRTVEKSGAKKMKAALGALTDKVEEDNQGREAQFKRDRAQKLVGKLEEPGALVQDLPEGQELQEAIAVHDDHTETKTNDEGTMLNMRRTSPLNIFYDSRSITALGRVTAVDLFTGNKDRLLVYYNAENLLVTPTSMTAIDNIWMGSDKGVFKTTLIKGQKVTDTDRGTDDRTITMDEALKEWKADPDVKNFAEGNFDDLSQKVFGSIRECAAQLEGESRSCSQAKFRFAYGQQQGLFSPLLQCGIEGP